MNAVAAGVACAGWPALKILLAGVLVGITVGAILQQLVTLALQERERRRR